MASGADQKDIKENDCFFDVVIGEILSSADFLKSVHIFLRENWKHTFSGCYHAAANRFSEVHVSSCEHKRNHGRCHVQERRDEIVIHCADRFVYTYHSESDARCGYHQQKAIDAGEVSDPVSKRTQMIWQWTVPGAKQRHTTRYGEKNHQLKKLKCTSKIMVRCMLTNGRKWYLIDAEWNQLVCYATKRSCHSRPLEVGNHS